MECVLNVKARLRGIYDGHVFQKINKSPNGDTNWKCDFTEADCHYRVVTDEEGDIIRSHVKHNHEPNQERIQVLRAINEMRFLGEFTDDPPESIVAKIKSSLSNPTSDMLPSDVSLEVMIEGIRYKETRHTIEQGEVSFLINKSKIGALVFDGHLFRAERTEEKDGAWKCHKGSCKARLTTKDGKPVLRYNDHNHDPPTTTTIRAKLIMNKLRELALNTDMSTQDILSEMSLPSDRAILAELPDVTAMVEEIEAIRDKTNLKTVKIDLLPEDMMVSIPLPAAITQNPEYTDRISKIASLEMKEAKINPKVEYFSGDEGNITFLDTHRKNGLVVHKDYTYSILCRSHKGDMYVWRCRNRKCKARLKIKNNRAVCRLNRHNHEPISSAYIESIQVLKKIKEMAASTELSTQEIVSNLPLPADESVLAELPNLKNIRSRINRIRSKTKVSNRPKREPSVFHRVQGEIKYVATSRAKKLVIHDEHLYRIHHTIDGGNVTIWRCRNKKCHARLRTRGNRAILRSNDHNHEPPSAFIEETSVMMKIINLATSTDLSPSAIFEQILPHIDESVAVRLPSRAAMVSAINRARAKNGKPKPTKSAEEIDLNNESFELFEFYDEDSIENIPRACAEETVSDEQQITLIQLKFEPNLPEANLILVGIDKLAQFQEIHNSRPEPSRPKHDFERPSSDDEIPPELNSDESPKDEMSPLRTQTKRILPVEIDFEGFDGDQCCQDDELELDVFRSNGTSSDREIVSVLYTFSMELSGGTSLDEAKSRVDDRLDRCRDWLEDQNRLERPPRPPNCEDEDENSYVKLRTRLRKQNLAKQTIEERCDWDDCDYLTDDYQKFQKHIIEHYISVLYNESNTGLYSCLWKLCGFKTENDKEFKRHVNFHAYHTRLKAVGEHINERYCLERCSLGSDEINQVPEILSDYVCHWTDCGFSLDSMQGFIDHVYCHVLGADEVLSKKKCGWLGCGSTCGSMSTLKMHTRRHTNEKIVACPQCGTMFAANSVYEDHCMRQINTGVKFKCETCGKFFSSERLLKNHVQHHVNSHKCQFCGTTFSAPSALVRHIRYAHLNYRPFKCQYCDHATVSKSDLQAHLLRHEGIKPVKKKNKYVCPHCNDLFAAGHYLTKHMIRVHQLTQGPGLSRFRYVKSEDGLYRLVDYRYESVEICEQHNYAYGTKNIDDTDHSYTNKKDNGRDEDEFRLVQFTEGTPNRLPSYAICSNAPEQNDKNTTDVKKEYDKKRKRPTAVKKPLKRVKFDLQTPEPDTEENSFQKTSNTEMIEISITDIDEDGNVINSAVVKTEDENLT